MKKFIFFFISSFFSNLIFGQEALPTINATSKSVDIRVGDDYFAKGGWRLDSTKIPDIFTIGSKWNYDHKKVSFITDIDSISFDVKPGCKYNFVIVLNQKTHYNIQILTLANPKFLNIKILIPLLLGLVLIILSIYHFSSRFKTKNLLYFGYISAPLFWLMTLISGAIHGNYNHFRNTISELGAIGTRSEVFTSSLLMLLTVFCILFSIGFYRASKKLSLSVVPSILSFTMPITMIWAGIFTLGNEFHSSTGPLPLLLILGFLLTGILWIRNKKFSLLTRSSLISFIISLLIFLRFIKPFSYEYAGLLQRLFYLAWTVWTISITYFFSKKIQPTSSTNREKM
jgi:hypothetical membrane protein